MAGFLARRSLSSSAAPSTLAGFASGRDRRLAATALAAAKDRSAAPARSRDGAERARLRAVRFVTMSSNALRMSRKAQKLRARHMLGHPNPCETKTGLAFVQLRVALGADAIQNSFFLEAQQ